jgi:dTDP-glucose 4,6-dehydratase
LGFVPAYRFEKALSGTVAWYLDHEPWWRAIQNNDYREWVDANYARRQDA